MKEFRISSGKESSNPYSLTVLTFHRNVKCYRIYLEHRLNIQIEYLSNPWPDYWAIQTMIWLDFFFCFRSKEQIRFLCVWMHFCFWIRNASKIMPGYPKHFTFLMKHSKLMFQAFQPPPLLFSCSIVIALNFLVGTELLWAFPFGFRLLNKTHLCHLVEQKPLSTWIQAHHIKTPVCLLCAVIYSVVSMITALNFSLL